MMTMRASSVLPPRPSYSAAAMAEEEDDYQALMLAEFGPLPSQDEVVQAMMLMLANNKEEIQPLLPEDEPQMMAVRVSAKTEMQARACPASPPCPDDKKCRKKRNNPPPQQDDKKGAREKRKRKNPPPPQQASDLEEASARPSKRAKEGIDELPSLSPRARNKMMASCLLKRRHSAPEPSGPERRTVIRCKCKEVKRDSPLCAVHQRSRHRWWMQQQGGGEIPTAGSSDGVVVPTTRTEGKCMVISYIRWRTRVWMPSRFYVEKVDMARHE